jgi:hypothetical protein
MASYDDQKPAILSNQIGKGSAMLVGVQAGQAYVTEHYWNRPGDAAFDPAAGEVARQLVARFSEARPLTVSVPGLLTSLWDTPGGTLLFLVNMTGAKVEPKISLEIPGGVPAHAVESAQHGPLKFSMQGKRADFSLQAGSCDIVFIRHK